MLTPLKADDPATIGPYRLQNRIGAGGMGVVYLGFDPDGQGAAIKVPMPALIRDREFRARFRREVAAARLVRGGRVATVLDADTDSNRPWMATEYVEGTSLAQAVTDRGPLDERLLAGLAVGLADALVAVHAAGVVHRDLKPNNILLAWDGPKVIDFGIAQSADSTRHTGTGMLIGTLVWMAPEQLRGERVDSSVDIFAWGACVAFAATGRPAFRGDRPEAIGIEIIEGEPDLAGVPANLLGPVRDALAKNPLRRPTAPDLVARLSGRNPGTLASVADTDRVADGLLELWRSSPPVPAPRESWDARPSDPLPAEAAWPPSRARPPAGPGVQPAGPTGPSPRRRTRGTVLLAALLVLLAGGGVVAGILLTRDRNEMAADATTPTSTSTSSVAPSPPAASPAATATGAPTPGGAGGPTRTGGTDTGTAEVTTPAGITLDDAEDIIIRDGYHILDSSFFSEDKILNVITAYEEGTADGAIQRAYIFAEGEFQGYDTSEPSANIIILSSADLELTLRYGLYDPEDDVCCPTDTADVAFYWDGNGNTFVALDEIPPSDPAVPGSRR